MAYVCDNCGKRRITGRSQRHGRGVAGKRWKKRAQVTTKVFKPNLQNFRGQRLCTRCIKKMKKEGKLP